MPERRGQVVYLAKMFLIDEKMEFKSDDSTTMINNIPDPIFFFKASVCSYFPVENILNDNDVKSFVNRILESSIHLLKNTNKTITI